MEVPSTPERQIYQKDHSPPSRIPSPSAIGSPKYTSRRESEDYMTSLSSNEHKELLEKTKNQVTEKKYNHMTYFYKENIKELSQLQEILVRKKQKLDLIRDDMISLKTKVDTLYLKIDKSKEEQKSIDQRLKFKKNELQSLNDEFETKKQFMNQGHELQLQQLLNKMESENNRLNSEYHSTLEKLKFEKIKKSQLDKTNLIEEVESLNNKILCNNQIFDDLLEETKRHHNVEKENWLRKFQNEWKDSVNKNETIIDDIHHLKKHILDELNPTVKEKIARIESLERELVTLTSQVNDAKTCNKNLKNSIKSTVQDIQKSHEEQEELGKYINNSQLELKQINEILIKEETMRRKLHNELQELRGNIRVYCRVRPLINNENQLLNHIKVSDFNASGGTQSISIEREGRINCFTFDKIFDTTAKNKDVFDEMGQLVQSSLDGYKVCIFAYGQTGSGKTFTMLNPQDGMIPMTLDHIFKWTDSLKQRGWSYKLESQFVEIYNESIIDLLRGFGNDSDEELADSGKHDIRHDHDRQLTEITNVNRCTLTNRDMVSKLLKRASKLRSTAATGLNERSSRSHSIFMIYIHGYNSLTGEECHGKLNLVDLAGSERISSSLVTGDRLRETQNINKSLSCLGDVIYALNGNDSKHIPFRNSKLTYLLQYSLVGDSKTLMFVNISPNINHINETLNSLRFASKVNSTKLSTKK